MTSKPTSSDIFDINKKTGALILGKNRLDDYATKYLTKHCKDALLTPMPLPVNEILQKAGLTVKEASLSKNLDIFGCCLLLDSEVEIYDRKQGTSEIVSFPAGTVLIDPDSEVIYGEGAKRNTLIHEALHWEKDKTYFEILKVKNAVASEKLYPIMCRQSETFYEPPKGKKTKENEVKWLEWQAHRLAPRVLMPHDMFKKKALELIGKYRNQENNIMPTCAGLIKELSVFFIVSRISVKYRLMEVGLLENITDFEDYETYFKEEESVEVYDITIAESFEVYLQNMTFKEMIDLGLFVYVQDRIVLNRPEYIKYSGRNCSLTELAIERPDLCTLRFGTQTDKTVTTSRNGVLFHKNGITGKTFRKNTGNLLLQDEAEYLAKDFECVLSRKQSHLTTANERMWAYIKEAKWNTTMFQYNTLLSPMDYSRIQKPDYSFKLPAYMAMAVGLNLTLSEFEDVIQPSGLGFKDGDRTHEAYRYILNMLRGRGIDVCNDFLESIGVTPLGTKERE